MKGVTRRELSLQRASEQEPHLELEHPRRIDIRERRQRVRRAAPRHELAERWVGGGGVAVDGLAAAQVVAVVQHVEAFDAEEDRVSGELQAVLDEEVDF